MDEQGLLREPTQLERRRLLMADRLKQFENKMRAQRKPESVYQPRQEGKIATYIETPTHDSSLAGLFSIQGGTLGSMRKGGLLNPWAWYMVELILKQEGKIPSWEEAVATRRVYLKSLNQQDNQ